MRIGKEKHEKILSETIEELESEGYKVLRTDGRTPTCIAFNRDEIVAVIILDNTNKRRTRTITELEDTYHMFDRIDRVLFKNRDRKEVIDEVIERYRERGYSAIYLRKKCPDAIAIRNGSVFAVEILGNHRGYSTTRLINDKTDLYDMFDGVMFKTFIYDSDDVFTETFGSKKQKQEMNELRM